MSTTIIRKTFHKAGVLADPYSVTLSAADASYGVKRNDTSAVVVADGTAMTKVSTGVYQHSFTDPASDLVYTYSVEVVANAGEGANWFVGTVNGSAASTSTVTNLWTATTLAAHLRGELDVDPNAAGGTVPDRLMNIVRETGISLWNMADWRFRLKRGTLTTVAGTSTVSVPSDFAEIAQRFLQHNSTSTGVSGLLFTEDKIYFQERADGYLSTDTGNPVVAVVDVDRSGSSWAQQFLLCPTPDAVYSFPYWYVIKDPWSLSTPLSDSSTPQWPPTFNMGWHLYALARAQRAFGKSEETWRESWAAFSDWFQRQLQENNETITTSNLEPIRGGYDDFFPGQDEPWTSECR